jgi:hypothetical protein
MISCPGADTWAIRIREKASWGLPDVFFVNLAITIMVGLGFATLLTLIFVPTLYSISIPDQIL